MIHILIATIIVVVFANASSKVGKNPINWSLIGLACFLLPSYLIVWLATWLVRSGVLVAGSWMQFWMFASVSGMVAGVALTIIAYRRMTQQDSDQES